MFRNNPILVQLKKKIRSKAPRVEGIVKKSDKGFGFLEVDSQTSYFIPPKQMKKVMHGDKIIGKVLIQREKEIIEPEKLIEPFLTRFVGKIKQKDNKFFIVPDYPSLSKDCIQCTIKNDLIHTFQDGDWAVAELESHRLLNNKNIFFAKLISFISNDKNYLTPWLVTLNSYNLEHKDPKILDKSEVKFDSFIERTDLTKLNFITIDDSETKDIDDAIFIKKTKKNYFSVIVAIADPTAYIKQDSRLDKIASNRIFTNYLPGFTVSMLPKKISEDVCSLLPEKKRPVLACKFIILEDGTLLESSICFFLAWIMSKKKLSYKKVSDWLEKKGSWKPDNTIIEYQIILLFQLCIKRISWRKKNALIFREKLEYRFKFSKEYKILDVYVEKRRIAHRVIEEVMILANICAAKFLSKKLGFGIFNIHKGFSDVTIAKHVISILSKFKINFSVENIITLDGFRKLYQSIYKLSNKYLENRIRRYQSFGEFSIHPSSHFSLGFREYATWTSPIRKYSDMINHRLIKSVLIGKKITKFSNDIISKINDRKKKHRMSERDVKDWLYSIYFYKKNNKTEIFVSEITDISRGGIRARLIVNGANVFIPSSFLHPVRNELFIDYENGIIYIKNLALYKITDQIKVQLMEIRMENRNIIAKPVFID
ncbi:Exoribonuclease 2 [Buchnera aphidicola (Tetraneura ulmi)]|uniref:exoribonuclease II n=1 Tax=Buchnera aphidicola TaxID=9 RepID=UPI0034639748